MIPSLESICWILACLVAIISYLLYSSGPIFDFTLSSDFRKAAFHATRLTSSTFLVKEYNDIYSEHPHIYAKVVPVANTILVIDTGCGGASYDSEIQIKNLREYIETVGLAENNGEPLNPKGAYKYVVVTTHCHYDHIRRFRSRDKITAANR